MGRYAYRRTSLAVDALGGGLMAARGAVVMERHRDQFPADDLTLGGQMNLVGLAYELRRDKNCYVVVAHSMVATGVFSLEVRIDRYFSAFASTDSRDEVNGGGATLRPD